ncbi:MAG: glucose-1-phosphate adenylyltransferase subunit GlgD [Tissierellia bacterium]|nr:glucose-1-phosphate adenylyltransferase subunit GlgD [Tissierellia bacterium]
MTKKVAGLINLGEKETYIRELTQYRPLATVPFAGRYCLIDFMLSSMINSGIGTISILVKDKFHSINDHLSYGKWWDLDRKTGGLRILYPDIKEETAFDGDLQRLGTNLIYFEKMKEDHILLTRSNYLGNINFKKAFEAHEKADTDITILSKKVTQGKTRVDLLGLDILVEDNGKTYIGQNLGNQDEFEMGIEMYFIKREVFMEIVKEALELGKEKSLSAAIARRLIKYSVQVYSLEEEILPIYSLQQYYNASLRILEEDKAHCLFYEHGRIHTKVKDAPSALYMEGSQVSNSLVANGCVIEGTVENSILFRNVRVEKGAVVRNSVVFQGSVIESNSQVNFAILDKRATIGRGKILMGDGGLPYFVGKGARII